MESSLGYRCSFLKFNKSLKNLIILGAISTCLPLASYAVDEFWHDSIQPTRPNINTINSLIDDFTTESTKELMEEDSAKTKATPNYTMQKSTPYYSVDESKYENYAEYGDEPEQPFDYSTGSSSLYTQQQQVLAKEQAIIKEIEIHGANNVSNEIIRQNMQMQHL